MVYEHLDYRVDGHLGIVTINRPEVMNALSFKTHEELARALEEADQNEEVRVIIVTGAGHAFCSGDDVSSIFLGNRPAINTRSCNSSTCRKKPLKAEVPGC